MDIDKSNSIAAQARMLDKKRDEVNRDEARLSMEHEKVVRRGTRDLAEARNKIQADLVEISKNGEQQVDLVRKMNNDRIAAANVNSQKSFEILAKDTADRIQKLQDEATKAIDNQKRSGMEKLMQNAALGEDPFYHVKSFSPTVAESAGGYDVKVALPPHEAKNLLVSGDGKTIKLTLARRFQDDSTDLEKGSKVRTNNFQTIVEQLAMPGIFDVKDIDRDYKDGVVTIKLKKPAIASFVAGSEKSEEKT